MSIRNFINSVASLGVKNGYQPWEIYLTRKLNLSSLLGFINVSAAAVIFAFFGYYDSIIEALIVLIVSPFVILFNIRFGYIQATYLFALVGIYLFFFLSVNMGARSFAFLYYFPLSIALIQMIGRKETYKHLLIIFFMILTSIAGIIYCYSHQLLQIQMSNEIQMTLRNFNIFMSFFTAVGFMFIISNEAIKQEAQLKSALQQKDVLLAELFHRVKNNLNIVTSLLNLKKNATNSQEAKNTLEECRNMVFSMAMVHTKVYNSSSIDHLNFKDYVNDLTRELINSVGGKEKVNIEITAHPITLSITHAIPCGLIINELITNSFKHACLPDRKLEVHIILKEEGDYIEFEVKDNGPGRDVTIENNSLGMELIRSLAEQLEANYEFRNNNGLQFNLKFKKL